MSSSEDAARLALAIGRINRRLRAGSGGMSHGLLSALSTVTKFGPIRLAELAQREAISAPSLTRVVAELEAQGLVLRSPDPADGRASLIEATDAGLDIIVRTRSVGVQVLSDLLDSLDPEDAATLTAALPVIEQLAGETVSVQG